MSHPFNQSISQIINLALEEDLGVNACDITSDTLFAEKNSSQQAHIISKHSEPLIVCGVEVIKILFSQLNPQSQVFSHRHDGEILNPGDTLLTLESDAITLLKGERPALNFLRHLTAIASLTAKYVAKVKHTPLKILDTRKTTPGLRELEKYAVSCGGGVNHRMGLYDAFVIKDTHIDMLGGMQNALQPLPLLKDHRLSVIVEVRSQQELEVVLQEGQHKVTRVLLDNMSPKAIQSCVLACNGIFETEASGNINLTNIAEIAETGVQFASIGCLTYGAGHADLSMTMRPTEK